MDIYEAFRAISLGPRLKESPMGRKQYAKIRKELIKIKGKLDKDGK